MIEEKLLNIQAKLKAPKNQFNKFGNYKYRSCEDILEALKPLLEEYKCTLIIEDDIVPCMNRIYVRAVATLYDVENRGEKISTSAYAREEETRKGQDSSQITGSSSSYARKYALNGLFLIDDTKDADATNTHGKEEKPAEKITKQQIDKIFELTEKGAIKLPAMLKYYNLEKLEDMTKEQAEEVIAKKEEKKEA